MTISAYELSDPEKFKNAIRSEFELCIDVAAAEELFCRRYSRHKTTTAYVAHDFAEEVFIELYRRLPNCSDMPQMSVLHQELVEWSRAPKDEKITKRSQSLYRQTYLCLYNEVERLVSAYQVIPEAKQQHRRLLRDSIDNNVRRFHQYCIQQNKQFPVQHYVDIDALQNGKPTVFEHVLPMSIARDLLLDNIFSIDQVFTIPTCSLGRDKDKVLKDKGWNNDTPDIYYYWKRYSESFEVDGVIQCKDGLSINFSESIEDHFQRSLTFLDYCKQGG